MASIKHLNLGNFYTYKDFFSLPDLKKVVVETKKLNSIVRSMIV